MPGGAPVGNNNATKNKPWSDAIRKFATQNPNKRDKVIEKLYQMAEDGDLLAIKEIIDRTEGKAAQSMAITGHLSTSDMTTEELMEAWRELQNAGKAG